MTTPTADQVIGLARLQFPAIPLSTDPFPNGLDLLNDVFSEVLFEHQILSVEANVSLTAGTPNYALPTGTVRLWSARYERSATQGDFVDLRFVSQDYMDDSGQENLRRGSGEPQDCWLVPSSTGVQQIWLSPSPATTTVTYPRLVVRVTKFVALGASDLLPSGLPSYDVFVFGLAKKWAGYVADEKYGIIDARYREAMGQLSRHRHSLNPRVVPRFVPKTGGRPVKV